MKGRIQHPRYTAAALAAKNPVLLNGEVVYESDTRKQKVGDGVTAWNNLPYEGGSYNPEVVTIASGEDVADATKYPFTATGQIFPLVIKMGATNNPTSDNSDYECIGTAQCTYYAGPNSWEAMLNVCVAESDMMPRDEFYQTHIDNMGIADWIKLGGSSDSGDSPIPGYKNILPAPKNEYFFTNFLGRQEITITFKNPISPADFSGNYMFIDAEIFENGAYTLASLPLTIARVNSIDDPIRLTECCLWSVKSISADYAYVSISLSNFTMQNGKYTGCRMTVVSDGMADASAYELHWRGLYLRAR